MKSATQLRQKIDRRELTVGMIVTHHLWLDLLEVARNAGFDFLIVDQEHVAFDEVLLGDFCAAARQVDFPVLIRPPETQYSLARRALDKGAVGLLLPQVDSLELMGEVREAIFMPPRGRRRVGGPGNRWVGDFNHETWVREVEDHLVILPQIESRDGMRVAEAVARLDFVTALAVGPYDLSTDLGVCWQPESPVLLNAIETIRSAATAAGKNTMMVGDGGTLIRNGFSFVCVAEPTAFLEASLKQHVAALRGGPRGDIPHPTSRPHVP